MVARQGQAAKMPSSRCQHGIGLSSRCIRDKWLCPPGIWPAKKMYCRDHAPPGSLNIKAARALNETSSFATAEFVPAPSSDCLGATDRLRLVWAAS